LKRQGAGDEISITGQKCLVVKIGIFSQYVVLYGIEKDYSANEGGKK